ncbi:hypothetical protein ACFFX1_33805 [Dactylosporangium sucinum]|nr:hypothetical protein [Dactylosporangium sucinum]
MPELPKKVVLGAVAVIAALAVALGIGLYVGQHGSAPRTPAAESRPAQEGEVVPPPAPPQLKPSERVVVTSK